MPLEDEINARLRCLSEEIRNWRKDVTEGRRHHRAVSTDPEPSRGSQPDDSHEPPDDDKPAR